MKKILFHIIAALLTTSVVTAEDPQILSLISDFVPNEKEELFNEIFLSSFEEGGGQGRAFAHRNRYLDQLARKLAKDRIDNDWYLPASHVSPDGYGPDWHLTQMGWKVPSYWKVTEKSNHIENVVVSVGGYFSPQEAWDAWMDSPPHKRSLLGESQFAKRSTSYGIGVYTYSEEREVPNGTIFTYQITLYVFISVPPDPDFPDLEESQVKPLPTGKIEVAIRDGEKVLTYSLSGNFSQGVLYHVERSSDLDTWDVVETYEFNSDSTQTIRTVLETTEDALYLRLRTESSLK